MSIPESGPKKRGPIAYARTKIDSTSCDSTSLVMPNSLEIVVRAGAIIEDETGEMNVNEETTKVAAHFRPNDQFLGFSGSSGPFHVICGQSVVLLAIKVFSRRNADKVCSFD